MYEAAGLIPATYALAGIAWLALTAFCLWALLRRPIILQFLSVLIMAYIWWVCWNAGLDHVSFASPAFATGLALGAFRTHTPRAAWRLYRACAYVTFFVLVALHPGFWGGSAFAFTFRREHLDPLLALALFGVAIQLGAALHELLLAEQRGRWRGLVRTELAGLRLRSSAEAPKGP